MISGYTQRHAPRILDPLRTRLGLEVRAGGGIRADTAGDARGVGVFAWGAGAGDGGGAWLAVASSARRAHVFDWSSGEGEPDRSFDCRRRHEGRTAGQRSDRKAVLEAGGRRAWLRGEGEGDAP